MTASDARVELRTAATRLRLLAADARVSVGDAPWLVQQMLDYTYGIWTEGTTLTGGDDQLASVNVEAHARWIAALSPAVAEPLAAWLEYEASNLDEWFNIGHLHCGLSDRSNPGRDAALAFARTVLASQQQETQP